MVAVVDIDNEGDALERRANLVGHGAPGFPLIGAEVFKIGSTTLVVSFIVSFGVVKACANLISGQLADKWGARGF